MSLPQLEIILVSSLVAVACAVVGVFLVLRKAALISDAIAHSILLGIVLAFFATGNLNSPLLVIGAAATGVLTVVLVELLSRSGRLKSDAAIGLVFPVLFSIGVILVSRYAGNIHLDTDAVLVGEIVYVPFDRLVLSGMDLGPRSLWVISTVLALNLLFILLYYKELKIATFDTGLAVALGFAPGLLNYLLMGLVSITAVSAFDAVGSILVVALMIAPPAAAYLLTKRLSTMLMLSAALGIASATGGYFMARLLDASISGSMASMAGVVFIACWVLSPERGLLTKALRTRRQRWEFAGQMLLVHLFQHEGTEQAECECSIPHLEDHFRWSGHFAQGVISRTKASRQIHVQGKQLHLTDSGRSLAKEILARA